MSCEPVLTSCLTQSVLNNGSLWADIFLTNGKASPNPADPSYDVNAVGHTRKRASPLSPPWLVQLC